MGGMCGGCDRDGRSEMRGGWDGDGRSEDRTRMGGVRIEQEWEK